MSEKLQRALRDLRDAALERESSTRERADRSRERGDSLMGRLHDELADDQHQAAEAAEERRVDDVAIEGEKLGEPGPGSDAVQRR